METYLPTADIEIGGHSFAEDPLLHGCIQVITVDKSMDKTVTRGKKRVKINTCNVTLFNPEWKTGVGHALDNILRWGKSLDIWLGYANNPLARVGVYRLEHVTWRYSPTKVPIITLVGKAGDIALKYARGGRTFVNKTHTQAARILTEEAGMLFDGQETNVRTTLCKGSEETHSDAIQRWAYDVGFESWVDDTTKPNTLHFKRAADIQPVVWGAAKQLVVGWLDTPGVTLPAQELAIDHHYPVMDCSTPTLQDNKAQPPVAPFFGPNGEVLYVGGGAAGLPQKKIQTGGLKRGSAVGGLLAAKTAAASSSATLSKVASMTFFPGVPYFQLAQKIPLVGVGDQSGTYTVVSISHNWSKKAYKTTVKASIGGLSKQTKQDKPPAPSPVAPFFGPNGEVLYVGGGAHRAGPTKGYRAEK